MTGEGTDEELMGSLRGFWEVVKENKRILSENRKIREKMAKFGHEGKLESDEDCQVLKETQLTEPQQMPKLKLKKSQSNSQNPLLS